MPRDNSIKKVLVIGSGPIVIGQAAEFDYSGTQACQALREEGVEVVLVNSNPATIMTDSQMADRTYIEPLTVETLENVIAKERPDSLIAGMGGPLTVRILTEGQAVLETVKELILQPQSELDKVRQFLRENRYKIVDEDIDGILSKIFFNVKKRNRIIRPCFSQNKL